MKSLTLFAAVFSAAIGICFTGCSKEDSSAGTSTASQNNDHGHDHGVDDHSHNDHGHAHGEEQDLGSITLSGTTLQIFLSGDISPNSEVPVEIVHSGGPMPESVRLWFGDESATGALKVKADSTGTNFHAHVETPSKINATDALWIEVESASGERTSQSVLINRS